MKNMDNSKKIINYLKYQRVIFNRQLPKILEDYSYNLKDFILLFRALTFVIKWFLSLEEKNAPKLILKIVNIITNKLSV